MAERAEDRRKDCGESRRQKGRLRREPKTEEKIAERAEDRRGDGGESRRQKGGWRREPKTDTQAGQTCGRLNTHSLVLLILPPVFQRRLDDAQKERVDGLGRGHDAKQSK